MDVDELKKQIANYKPKQEVLEAMRHLSLAATVGPSATGKTVIMTEALKLSPDVKKVLDETSRLPRPDEKNGEDYLFRSREDMLEDLKQGNLVQMAIGPNGQLYATRVGSFPKDRIGIMALIPTGVRQFRQLGLGLFNAGFVVPVSYEQWQRWFEAQADLSGWSEELKNGRLKEAQASYEFALSDEKMHFILNDTAEKAAQRFLQVARGETPNDEQQALNIAELNYKKLMTSGL